MLPLALGTQTGGSVIRPASFCGVVGVKPSFRLLPTVGVKCFSWALDTVGLFAAGVADAARALALLADRPGLDLPPTGPGTLRIGLVRQDFCEAPSPRRSRPSPGRRWRRSGPGRACTTSPAGPVRRRLRGPSDDPGVRGAPGPGLEYAHHREALPPALRAALDEAQGLGTQDYDAARRTAHHARRSLKDVFGDGGVDVILTYSSAGAAPAGLASTGDSRFNRLWTLMGVPCVTVPAGTDDGLPLGVQVIARFGDDGRALAAARLIEQALA